MGEKPIIARTFLRRGDPLRDASRTEGVSRRVERGHAECDPEPGSAEPRRGESRRASRPRADCKTLLGKRRSPALSIGEGSRFYPRNHLRLEARLGPETADAGGGCNSVHRGSSVCGHEPAERVRIISVKGWPKRVINALAKIEGLRVAARTSTFQFKGKAEDIRTIGKRSTWKTVLEGSVRTAGSRLRVTAQLIGVSDGYDIWSDRYDGTMEDVFAIQDEIASKIVGALKVKLVGAAEGPRVKRHTDNLDAYHLYLRGRHFWMARFKGGLQKAREWLRAIDRIGSVLCRGLRGTRRLSHDLGLYGFVEAEVGLRYGERRRRARARARR